MFRSWFWSFIKRRVNTFMWWKRAEIFGFLFFIVSFVIFRDNPVFFYLVSDNRCRYLDRACEWCDGGAFWCRCLLVQCGGVRYVLNRMWRFVNQIDAINMLLFHQICVCKARWMYEDDFGGDSSRRICPFSTFANSSKNELKLDQRGSSLLRWSCSRLRAVHPALFICLDTSTWRAINILCENHKGTDWYLLYSWDEWPFDLDGQPLFFSSQLKLWTRPRKVHSRVLNKSTGQVWLLNLWPSPLNCWSTGVT